MKHTLLRLETVRCGDNMCQSLKFKVYGINDIELCFVCDLCGSVYTIRTMELTKKKEKKL